MEERKICVEFWEPNINCSYAKIVEEEGECIVATFIANGEDKEGQREVRYRTDYTTCNVYCTHPNCPGKKRENGVFIGTIEPYFPFNVPKKCPKYYPEIEQSTPKRKRGIRSKLRRFIRKISMLHY